MKFYQSPVPKDDFLEAVKIGLRKEQKSISPKYFYDRRGSELFEEIVNLDEYYIPEAEIEIYRTYAKEVGQLFQGENLAIVELGSGSSEKIREIIDHLPTLKFYVPIDISESFLKQSAAEFAKDHPQVEVIGLAADFTFQWEIPKELSDLNSQKMFYFPGSTIGNFERGQAVSLLKSIKDKMGPSDGILVGADRIKDSAILKKAYNDSKGVTAKFNKNLLHRMKNELGAEFDETDFKHEAIFNQELQRMEMHLFAKKDLTVKLEGETFSFKEGESFHTESSHKYSPESFETLAQEAGLKIESYWADSKELFSVYLLRSN